MFLSSSALRLLILLRYRVSSSFRIDCRFIDLGILLDRYFKSRVKDALSTRLNGRLFIIINLSKITLNSSKLKDIELERLFPVLIVEELLNESETLVIKFLLLLLLLTLLESLSLRCLL